MIGRAGFAGLLGIATMLMLMLPASADDGDGVWRAEMMKGVGPMAWVNGEVIHGDRYSILIRGDACDQAESFVTFYTVKKHPQIAEINGKFLSVNYNGSVIKAKALYPQPAMLGHLVLVHFGVVPVEAALRQNAGVTLVKGQLLDTPEFKASDYFDITENAWSTTGLPKAVAAAQALCRKAKG